MLRDFGIVTVVDLTVSLLGVMIVLPAALLWAEQHGPFRVRDLLGRACRPGARAAGRAVSRAAATNGDDRFEDLSIGERLAERDRTHPEPDAPARGPASRRTSTRGLVGILILMGLGVLLFTQTLPNQRRGRSGARSRASGCPPSRRPRAAGNLEGDANVCQHRPCTEGRRQASRPARCAARTS